MRPDDLLESERVTQWMNQNAYLSLAKRSLKAAEVQIERIWMDTKTRPTGFLEMAEANELKLIDIHFFFISIRNVHRFLNKALAGDHASDELRAQFKLLNEEWLKHYSKARDAFEHIDERLPGKKYEDRIVQVGNRKIHYGIAWSEARFKHSDQSWDISQKTFETIKLNVMKIIDELSTVS